MYNWRAGGLIILDGIELLVITRDLTVVVLTIPVLPRSSSVGWVGPQTVCPESGAILAQEFPGSNTVSFNWNIFPVGLFFGIAWGNYGGYRGRSPYTARA